MRDKGGYLLIGESMLKKKLSIGEKITMVRGGCGHLGTKRGQLFEKNNLLIKR